MFTKIANKEKTWQKTITWLFQFTCGHIKPIPSSVETKGIEEFFFDKIRE